MISWIRRHPLATVLLAAILLRIVAVLFSKGFMASDDQYETVDVAYNWLQNGLFSKEGLLTWGGTVARDVARFPLYALTLYYIMKVYSVVGYDNLDTIMYGVRFFHALLSLLSVYAVYRIIEISTESKRWALYGGLAIATHAAMPFLSVRTLIEVVGGHFWILSLLLCYRYRRSRETKMLLFAGLLAGLAWMIRFEIAFAIAPVPFLLWFEYRSMRPALFFSSAVACMLMISGIMDLLLLGSFADSTVNHLLQVFTEQPPYQTSMFIYAYVLLLFAIPPLSFALFPLVFSRSFWSRHRLVIISTLSFIVLHTLSSSRQERYMIPVIPELIVILTLATHAHWAKNGFFRRKKKLFLSVLIPALLVNFALLPLFTTFYSHKSEVEPLVAISRVSESGGVIWVVPEVSGIYPHYYAGFGNRQFYYLNDWESTESLKVTTKEYDWRYLVVYPPQPAEIGRYVDSLDSYFGTVTTVEHIEPNVMSRLLHFLNPKHNRLKDVWVLAIDPKGIT